jgi:hypothetical protein
VQGRGWSQVGLGARRISLSLIELCRQCEATVQSKEIEVRTIWKLVRGGRVRLMGFKK